MVRRSSWGRCRLCGWKECNLGELAQLDVPVLPGFTTTAGAYEDYVEQTGTGEATEEELSDLFDETDEAVKRSITSLIEDAHLQDGPVESWPDTAWCVPQRSSLSSVIGPHHLPVMPLAADC